MKRVYITGYHSYEMGIFQDKDPKIPIIKKSLKNRLLSYLDSGLEWVILSGNLGVEMWAGEIVGELKKSYPELQLAVVYPFLEMNKNWQEPNLLKSERLELAADFVAAVSEKPYQSPQQFKNHTQFLLEHTDGTLLVYDDEFPGKPKFFYQAAKNYEKQHDYLVEFITMDDLAEAAREYE